MHRFPSHWFITRGWLACVAVVLVLLALPGQVSAQAHSLRVTLRDVHGVGLPDVTVLVRSADGRELTQQVTDTDGAASFDALAGVVRVAIDGQPRGGPRLYQLGDDARGVRVVLDAGATTLTLNLRAERDGLVLPDPATMLTLEEGGPLVLDSASIPTAAVATPAPLPTAGRTDSQPGTAPRADSTPPPHADWVPPVTVLILVVAACLLRLVQKLRSL
jgi:hypothetical protein